MDALDLDAPSLIKIDAQYHEKEIIEGATKTLTKHKPMIVFESCVNFEDRDMTHSALRTLEGLGYQFYFPCWATEKGVVPSEVDKSNFVSNYLALVPIKTEERFLYRDMINILACHESKISDLESKFRS